MDTFRGVNLSWTRLAKRNSPHPPSLSENSSIFSAAKLVNLRNAFLCFLNSRLSLATRIRIWKRNEPWTRQYGPAKFDLCPTVTTDERSACVSSYTGVIGTVRILCIFTRFLRPINLCTLRPHYISRTCVYISIHRTLSVRGLVTWLSLGTHESMQHNIQRSIYESVLYLCTLTDGIVSYSMPQGDKRNSDWEFYDATYDGYWNEELQHGLGQLTDGKIGPDYIKMGFYDNERSKHNT